MTTLPMQTPGNTRARRRSLIQPRRVVVTGLGAVSSLGSNARETWRRILDGETGIRRIKDIDESQHSCLVRGDVNDEAMPNTFLTAKEARTTSRFARMAVEAAGEALIDAGFLDIDHQPHPSLRSAGVALGSCLGGYYDDVLPVHASHIEQHRMRVPPHLHVMCPNNLAAYAIHQRFNLHGPSSTVVTACATGSQAIGTGFHAIKYGQATMMVTGAADSTHQPLFLGGFEAMRALVTDSNDHPENASRPFDASRAGFVLGEGAGILVLEEMEHALARNAHIYAEISGFASSNDAFHPIAPSPDGSGAAEAMNAALADAELDPDQIDHVNAHAASTQLGDLAEARAIELVFGKRAGSLPVTSIKGAIGHCMAATGAIETVASILTIAQGVIPPTRNFLTPDPLIDLNVVHNAPQYADISAMTKHSFGLGGQNACLVIERFDPAA